MSATWTHELRNVELPNPLNGGQWVRYAAARRRKRMRATMKLVLARGRREIPPEPPVVVTLTRISRGTLDAWDGLPASLKSAIDGVADYFDTRDDDARITWRVQQERPATGDEPAKGRVHLRIEITRREGP